MSLTPWEVSMTAAMRSVMRQEKFDILNLYLKLEAASKKYFEAGAMKEGDVFVVPLENGTFLEQHFFKNYSTLDAVRSDSQIVHMITKEDSTNHEYRQLLGYSQALEDSKLGIGPHYPEEFKKTLQEIKTGQVLVCGNGRSYVCQCNRDGLLQLVRKSNSTKIPHISEFNESELVSVVLSDSLSIQHFYTQLKDDYNDDVRFRITTTCRAQEILNQCLAGLDKQTKLLRIGPNEIRIKRHPLSKALSYYDSQGLKVPEESVKIALGWLDKAPVVTEFRRSASTEETEFNDNMIRGDLDSLFAMEGYEEACTLLAGYCKENEKDLSVSFSSYVGGEAVSFAFKYHNGACHIYKATFADNNYESDPAEVREVSLDEFVAFCKIKYDETFVRVRNEVQNRILAEYPQYHGEFLDKVIDSMTEKKIKSERLFVPDKVEVVHEDLSTLIDSLEEECERGE